MRYDSYHFKHENYLHYCHIIVYLHLIKRTEAVSDENNSEEAFMSEIIITMITQYTRISGKRKCIGYDSDVKDAD